MYNVVVIWAVLGICSGFEEESETSQLLCILVGSVGRGLRGGFRGRPSLQAGRPVGGTSAVWV